jgi:hypothetical protein
LRWWEHSDFGVRHILEAAELVAFEILEPALRSRGGIQEQSKALYADEEFTARMQTLFQGEPTGCLMILTLQDALDRIEELENRVRSLEDLTKSGEGT